MQQMYYAGGGESSTRNTRKRRQNRSPPLLLKDDSIPIFNLGTTSDIMQIIDRVQRNAAAGMTLS